MNGLFRGGRCGEALLLGAVLLSGGVAPVQAGLLVSSASTSSVLAYNGSTGTYVDDAIKQGTGGLSRPMNMIFTPAGELLVCDEDHNNVLKYHLKPPASVAPFVTGLDHPLGLAYGPDGHLYVSNGGTNSVLRFNGATGAAMGVFAANAALTDPTGLVFGPDGNLYVGSGDGNKIVRFNGTTGAFIDIFVAAGSGGLDFPTGLVFGPDSNLYVSSLNTSSVLRYNGSTGASMGVFASGGGLAGAAGLSFGPDGHVYVAGYDSNNVVRYDGTSGAFIDAFVSAGSGGLFNPALGLLFTPLRAPGGLEARVLTLAQIGLAWTDTNDDETGYTVWRKAGAGDWTRIAVLPANAGSYVDGGLNPNTSYTYRVRAINNRELSPWSEEVPRSILLPAPRAPRSVVAATYSTTQINVAWEDISSNETAFALWRKGGGADWARIAVLPPNMTFFADSGLASDTTYTYRLRAVGPGGASDWTPEVMAATTPPPPPPAPTELVATPASALAINLNWHDNSLTETAFAVWRKTGAGAYARVAVVPTNTHVFSDTGLTPGTSYSYQVRAIGMGGASSFSNEATASTMAP